MKISPDATRSGALNWPQLIPGVLIKRYKRFMADVKLDTGETITAHCPNSGSMKACCEPGRRVFLSHHDNPKRKLKYTWELIEMPSSLVGVNTMVPNRLVFKTIETGGIQGLSGYDEIVREVKVRNNARLDLLLTNGNQKHCYVEIKNCTLVQNGAATFPDAVTSRGLKHLMEMQQLLSSGHRCVMFYLIQRMDAKRFAPADHIDPAYGKALRQAVKKGVEMLVYDVHIDFEKIALRNQIPYVLQ
jgi:sugar fermentation stimulation protein A